MFNIQNEILINKFAQSVIGDDQILANFNAYDLASKRDYLNQLTTYIFQSKPCEDDIELAITLASLKKTFTPCVLLKKNGIKPYSLTVLVNLPESELKKVLILFLNLFKVAYNRRFITEKNHPDKWWYWDLSDARNLVELEKIIHTR